MSAARLWPLSIVAVLALTVGANAVLIYEAGGRDAPAIEPDYYRKAVAWDSTLAQRARDAARGWRLEASLLPPVRGGMPITVRLTDADGTPLADAAVSVEAIHDAAGVPRIRSALRPAPGGGYVAVLPTTHPGLWELRFEVARRGERFTATLHRDVAASAR